MKMAVMITEKIMPFFMKASFCAKKTMNLGHLHDPHTFMVLCVF
jgi:hypothetical protein